MAKQVKKVGKKVSNRIKEDNERGARQNLIEELFFDFNRSKTQVFLINFQRGIFFGIGSVIGGALVIVLSAFLLTGFANILPGAIGDFIQAILDAMEQRAA